MRTEPVKDLMVSGAPDGRRVGEGMCKGYAIRLQEDDHEQTEIQLVGIREEHNPGIPWIETGI